MCLQVIDKTKKKHEIWIQEIFIQPSKSANKFLRTTFTSNSILYVVIS